MTFKWAPRVTSTSDYFDYSGTRYLMTQKSNFWCHLIIYPSPGMESWWALPHKSFQNHLSDWEALGGSLKRELPCDTQHFASNFSGAASHPAYSLCQQQFFQYLSVMLSPRRERIIEKQNWSLLSYFGKQWSLSWILLLCLPFWEGKESVTMEDI